MHAPLLALLALLSPVRAEAPAHIPVPIINGESATEADWPMTGGMMMDADMHFGGHNGHFRMLVCSSTLIAPDVVLLAAHCIDPDSFTYGYGSLTNIDIRWSRLADLSAHDGSSVAEWPADAVPAWDWVHHPEWDIWGLSTGVGHSYDIALLFLDQAVTDVPFAYLPTTEEAVQIALEDEVTIIGWGQQTDDRYPPAGTYGYKQMGISNVSELGEYELQVGLEPEDVRKCHGDSGGPTFKLFQTDTIDPWRQIGITSHAYDQTDCRMTGGVDTRVDAYLGWIDGELRARCADGTRVWCEEEGIPVAPVPAPVDTADDGDTGGDDDDDFFGCGCASGGAGGGMAALLLGALGLTLARRRRG
ncbi:MAG: trypsin-like serine protease [Pseudomonadota bacterium]